MTNTYYSPRFTKPSPDATSFVEITLVSADNLAASPRWSGRPIKVHAEVQLDGGAVKKSEADVAGGRSPTWNFTVKYDITSSTGGNLVVRLYYKKSLRHKLIGEVKIDLMSLFDMGGLKFENAVTITHPVEGKLHAHGHGRLNISYKFGLHFAG